MKNEELIHKVVEKIKYHPKLIAIILFGSYSKGIIKPLSDIDIAVILKEPKEEDEAEIGSLYSEKLDLVLFHRLPLYIQYEVLKYGKEIFVRDEKALSEVKLEILKKYLDTKPMYERIRKSILGKK